MANFSAILKQALLKAASAAATAAKSTVANVGLGTTAFAPGSVDAVVYNGELVNTPSSSNVRFFQYDFRRKIMTIGYGNVKGGGTYRYFQVPPQKAAQLFTAGSTGGAVWSLFRVRGSKTLHQHPYLRAA